MMVAAPRASAMEFLRSSAPTAAPANMITVDATRLFHRGLAPPAKEEAAPRPVRASVTRARARKSKENYVARHIRGKDMAQREKAHGIDHAGDRRQGEESAEHISFGRGGCHKLFRHIALFVHRRALNTVITILGR